MMLLSHIRLRAGKALVPFLGAGAVFYFGFHAVHGERGIMDWFNLQQQVAQAADLREQSASQRASLEYRVKLLSPETLDVDMLEERARLVLNMGRDSEMVIFDGNL